MYKSFTNIQLRQVAMLSLAPSSVILWDQIDYIMHKARQLTNHMKPYGHCETLRIGTTHQHVQVKGHITKEEGIYLPQVTGNGGKSSTKGDKTEWRGHFSTKRAL